MLVGTTVWYVGGTSLHIVAAVLIVGSTEGSTKSPTGGTCSCNVPLEAVACSVSCRGTPDMFSHLRGEVGVPAGFNKQM